LSGKWGNNTDGYSVVMKSFSKWLCGPYNLLKTTFAIEIWMNVLGLLRLKLSAYTSVTTVSTSL
jgi:hypothetical protein